MAMPLALVRLEPILAAARSFETGRFNHRHSMQYATYLYLLSNTAWRAGVPTSFCERLFCLNRALHAVDLFFALALPELFLISHGQGLVLGNTVYGERLVASQNVTVGRVGDARPTIGARVTLYPGAVVSGRSNVGDGAVIAAGTILHNIDVPPDTVASPGWDGPVFRRRKHDLNALYLA